MEVIDHFRSMPSDELWKLHEALTAQLGSKLAVEKVKLAERERRLCKLLESLDASGAIECGSNTHLASLPYRPRCSRRAKYASVDFTAGSLRFREKARRKYFNFAQRRRAASMNS